MNRPTVLVVGVRPPTEARLRSTFQDVELVTLPNGRWTRETLRELGPAAAILKLNGETEATFRLVHDLAESGARVLVVGHEKDPELILRAMRAGAREFVLAEDDDGLCRALREQLKPLRSADSGSVYAMFPAKGGVGATTLATNLAGVLQRKGERTCLVDLNLSMGDVLAFLDLPGGYSIADVIANMGRLDRALLDSSLQQHASGVHVLAQAHRIEESDRVDPAALASLLSFLRQHYGAIVLDGLRSFDELSLAAVDSADQIVLVVTQEVPAVRDARRCVDLFRRLGCDGKLKLVVNRFQKVEITTAVVEETVGVPVSATIANDYPAVIRAVNKGQLVLDAAPRSIVTKNVEALAAALGHAPAEELREKGSILSRFFAARTSHAT